MNAFPHWPDISRLTMDCLCCAIGACDGSIHSEDLMFAAACQNEIDARLRAAEIRNRPYVPTTELPKLVHKPIEVFA